MAFSQASISDVRVTRDGVDLLVSWSSSAPSGTTFQLYVAGMLTWHGFARSAVVPAPPAGSSTRFDVGTVAADEGLVDFSASLPTPGGGGNRVELTWAGGDYLAADIAGYYVYGGTTAGGAVSYASPLAAIPAYLAGQVTSGYGMGGYGAGGYGAAAASYSWTSGPLSGGTWNFAVKSFDAAGNLGTARTTSAVVAAPPNPPAANAAGKRLTYLFNPVSHVATLSWLASP
jgi:hypothetical protein